MDVYKIKFKKQGKVTLKILAGFLAGVFLFVNISSSAQDNLAPSLRLLRRDFKKTYHIGNTLLAHKVVNKVIREYLCDYFNTEPDEKVDITQLPQYRQETVRVQIKNKTKEIQIPIIGIPDLLRNTGQSGHIGLGRWNNSLVIYIDSKYFYVENDALKHDRQEIAKWEVKKIELENELGQSISHKEMSKIIRKKADAKTWRDEFHESAVDLAVFYSQLRKEDLNLDKIYDLYYEFGLDKKDEGFNIAAHDPGKDIEDPEMVKRVLPPKISNPDKIADFILTRFRDRWQEALSLMGVHLLNPDRWPFIDRALEADLPIYVIADLVRYRALDGKVIVETFPEPFQKLLLERSKTRRGLNRLVVNMLWYFYSNVKKIYNELPELSRLEKLTIKKYPFLQDKLDRITSDPDRQPRDSELSELALSVRWDANSSDRTIAQSNRDYLGWGAETGTKKGEKIKFSKKEIYGKDNGPDLEVSFYGPKNETPGRLSVWLIDKDILEKLEKNKPMLIGSVMYREDINKSITFIDVVQMWLRVHDRMPEEVREKLKVFRGGEGLIKKIFDMFQARNKKTKYNVMPTGNRLFNEATDPLHRNTIARLNELFSRGSILMRDELNETWLWVQVLSHAKGSGEKGIGTLDISDHELKRMRAKLEKAKKKRAQQDSGQKNAAKKREQAKKRFETHEKYLEHLDLKGTIQQAGEKDLTNMIEMIKGSTQINLNHKKYTLKGLRTIVTDTNYLVYMLDIKDRYDQYGIVGLIILDIHEKNPFINIKGFYLKDGSEKLTAGEALFVHAVEQARKRKGSPNCLTFADWSVPFDEDKDDYNSEITKFNPRMGKFLKGLGLNVPDRKPYVWPSLAGMPSCLLFRSQIEWPFSNVKTFVTINSGPRKKILVSDIKNLLLRDIISGGFKYKDTYDVEKHGSEEQGYMEYHSYAYVPKGKNLSDAMKQCSAGVTISLMHDCTHQPHDPILDSWYIDEKIINLIGKGNIHDDKAGIGLLLGMALSSFGYRKYFEKTRTLLVQGLIHLAQKENDDVEEVFMGMLDVDLGGEDLMNILKEPFIFPKDESTPEIYENNGSPGSFLETIKNHSDLMTAARSKEGFAVDEMLLRYREADDGIKRNSVYSEIKILRSLGILVKIRGKNCYRFSDMMIGPAYYNKEIMQKIEDIDLSTLDRLKQELQYILSRVKKGEKLGTVTSDGLNQAKYWWRMHRGEFEYGDSKGIELANLSLKVHLATVEKLLNKKPRTDFYNLSDTDKIKAYLDTLVKPDADYTSTLINVICDIRYKVSKRRVERPLYAGSIPENKISMVRAFIRLHLMNFINTHIKEPEIDKKSYKIRAWKGYGAPSQQSLLTKIRKMSKGRKWEIDFDNVGELIAFASNPENMDDETVTILPLNDQTRHLAGSGARIIYINLDREELGAYNLSPLEGVLSTGKAYISNDETAFYRAYELLTKRKSYGHISLEKLKENPVLFIESLKFILKPITAYNLKEAAQINERIKQFLIAA